MSNELIKQEKKSQISIGAFQGSRSLTFNNLAEIHNFAQMVCKTDLAPKAYRGKPEDATIAIIYGMEIGLPPLASLQNIAVVNGSPTIYGDGQLSLVQASGKLEWHKSYYTGNYPDDNFTAVFEVKRIGANQESVKKEYSIADAKIAGLWKKAGTWTTNPKLMLLYKPKSYALREAFADILKGMKSTEELEGEIMDITPKSSDSERPNEQSFKLPDVSPQFEPRQVDIEELVSDSTREKSTEIKDKIIENLQSLKNEKAINTYLVTIKNDMDFLDVNAPEFKSLIVGIVSEKLEELQNDK